MRPIYKRVWDFLGSRDLSVFIFVMGMTYFLILAIFGTVVPLPGVTNISKLLPYKVLYIIFFINLLICEIKWIPVVIRKCKIPKPPETVEELGRFGHRRELRVAEFGVRNIEKYLKLKGYKIQGADEKNSSLLLYAHKGRFSSIGNLLFHLSFLFLLAGVGLSMFYNFDGTLLLVEGQGVSKGDVAYVYSSASELTLPPRITFEVDKITPAFWKEMLLFTELKADISYNGKKGVVRLSQPVRLDGARVTITGMGIAPAYLLRDGQGGELDRGYVSLNIFMPGSEDQFQIPESPYKVRMSFYPDFELRDGRAFNRSMNPVNPTFEVRVFKYRDRVFKGFLRPGEEARFDGLRLSFPELHYSGIFRVVYDKGVPFIWAGFIMMIAGLIWRLVFFKREVAVWRDKSGERHIGVWSEYYKGLFYSEIECLAKLS